MSLSKEDILKAACFYFEITPKELFAHSRKRNLVYKRQMCTFLLLTDGIGTLIEHQKFILHHSGVLYNHTTLIHSRDKISDEKGIYPQIAKDIAEIRKTYPAVQNYVQHTTGSKTINYQY